MFNIYMFSFRIDIIINNLYQLPKTTLLLRSFKEQIYDIVLVPEDAFCIIKVEYLLSDTKYNLMTTPIRKC